MESRNGRFGYAEPHCADNDFTVTLGVYLDGLLTSKYIGNGVNVFKFIRMEIDAEDNKLKPWYNSDSGALNVLKYSNEENMCIQCNKGVSVSYV